MFLLDALSRTVRQDITHSDDLEEDIEARILTLMQDLPVSSAKLQDIRTETDRDATLQTLKNVVMRGWPSIRSQTPEVVHPFWNYRDEITVVDDLLFKGQRLIIPTGLQSKVLKRIHAGHLGMDRCKGRAREYVFWPQINAQIEGTVSNCAICQTHCKPSIESQ